MRKSNTLLLSILIILALTPVLRIQETPYIDQNTTLPMNTPQPATLADSVDRTFQIKETMNATFSERITQSSTQFHANGWTFDNATAQVSNLNETTIQTTSWTDHEEVWRRTQDNLRGFNIATKLEFENDTKMNSFRFQIKANNAEISRLWNFVREFTLDIKTTSENLPDSSIFTTTLNLSENVYINETTTTLSNHFQNKIQSNPDQSIIFQPTNLTLYLDHVIFEKNEPYWFIINTLSNNLESGLVSFRFNEENTQLNLFRNETHGWDEYIEHTWSPLDGPLDNAEIDLYLEIETQNVFLEPNSLGMTLNDHLLDDNGETSFEVNNVNTLSVWDSLNNALYEYNVEINTNLHKTRNEFISCEYETIEDNIHWSLSLENTDTTSLNSFDQNLAFTIPVSIVPESVNIFPIVDSEIQEQIISWDVPSSSQKYDLSWTNLNLFEAINIENTTIVVREKQELNGSVEISNQDFQNIEIEYFFLQNEEIIQNHEQSRNFSFDMTTLNTGDYNLKCFYICSETLRVGYLVEEIEVIHENLSNVNITLLYDNGEVMTEIDWVSLTISPNSIMNYHNEDGVFLFEDLAFGHYTVDYVYRGTSIRRLGSIEVNNYTHEFTLKTNLLPSPPPSEDDTNGRDENPNGRALQTFEIDGYSVSLVSITAIISIGYVFKKRNNF